MARAAAAAPAMPSSAGKRFRGQPIKLRQRCEAQARAGARRHRPRGVIDCGVAAAGGGRLAPTGCMLKPKTLHATINVPPCQVGAVLLSDHPCLLSNPRTWRPRHAQLGANVDMSLSGRRPAAFEKVLAARPELKAARFLRCDIDDPDSLAAALEVGLDLRLVQGAGSLQADSGS